MDEQQDECESLPTMIPSLPVEVLENILIHLDGLTLARAEMVCTVWRAVAEGIKKRTNVWKRICRVEMDSEDIFDITSHLCPSSQMKQIWENKLIDWCTVYKNHKSWKYVQQSNFQPRQILAIDKNEVTILCVKTTGSCVISGDSNGAVNLWSQEGALLCQLGLHRFGRVTDLGLLSFCDGPESDWDINHEYVISTSSDNSIHISPICPPCKLPTADKIMLVDEHETATTMVRVHGDKFAVISEDLHVSLWLVKPPQVLFAPPEVKPMAHIQPMGKGPLGFSFQACRPLVNDRRIKFSGMSSSGRRFTMRINPEKERIERRVTMFWSQESGRFPKLYTTTGGCKLVRKTFMKFAKGYVWRDQLFIWLTGRQTLCLSIDGEKYKEYDIMSILQEGFPTSVMVFQKMMFIGLDSGAVVCYYFAAAIDLLYFDFSKYSSKFQMCCSPIHVLDVSVKESATWLLGVSQNGMHIVRIM